MSNPEPNIRRATRRHRGPLWGLIAIGVFITLLSTVYFPGWGQSERVEESELEPIERIDGEIMGVVPREGQEIARDVTPGPVGVMPDAAGVDVGSQDPAE